MVPSIGPPKPYRDRQLPPPGTASTASKTSMESRPLPSPPSQDKLNASSDNFDRRFSPLPPPPTESNDNPPAPFSPQAQPNPIPPSSESPESRPVSYYSTVAADDNSDGLYSSVLNDEELEMLRQQVSGSELPVTVRYTSDDVPEPTNDTPPPTEPRDEEHTPRVEVRAVMVKNINGTLQRGVNASVVKIFGHGPLDTPNLYTYSKPLTLTIQYAVTEEVNFYSFEHHRKCPY